MDTDLAYKFVIFFKDQTDRILNLEYADPSDLMYLNTELDKFKAKLNDTNSVDEILRTELIKLDLNIDAEFLEKNKQSIIDHATRLTLSGLYFFFPVYEGSKSHRLKHKVKDFSYQIDYLISLQHDDVRVEQGSGDNATTSL